MMQRRSKGRSKLDYKNRMTSETLGSATPVTRDELIDSSHTSPSRHSDMRWCEKVSAATKAQGCRKDGTAK